MTDTRRTALITGSGRNIGRAIALGLAAAGHNVIINGSTRRGLCDSVAEEARALGVDALVIMANVGEKEAIAAMAGQALEKFGAIDILVNNAAIRPKKAFLEIEDADWDLVMNTDLKGALRLCQAFLPGMIEKGWGRIINFAGMNAIKGHAGRAHVSAAKHAVWGLTKTLADEFGSKGITINIISPGPILGERDTAAKAAMIEADLKNIPVGRLGAPEEVAAAAVMLASDGGAFINGQMIQVNGGAVM